MTREDAIKTLKENLCSQCAYGSQCMELCDIRSCDNMDAIKVLEQEPCEDAISRKAMLDYQQYLHGKMSNEENHKLWEFIKDLPPVTPTKCIATIKFSKEDMQELVNERIKEITLEQDFILDKIRAEIETNAYPIVHGVNNHEKGMTLYGILQIIDKYKAESEE